MENKDDRGTIEIIRENPYMQYFLGFDTFQYDAIFDPSLFVYIRKRLGTHEFDQMNQLLILQALKAEEEKTKDKPSDKGNQAPPPPSPIKNKGKLQMDATIADSHIKYPTDLNLLNQAREKTEELITFLCKEDGRTKPRTYKIAARKNYLNLAKKKKKSRTEIRKVIRKQLGYLGRNIKHLNYLFESNEALLLRLGKRDYKYLLVVQELHRQQQEMYDSKTNTI